MPSGKRWGFRAVGFLALIGLGGCSTLSYYFQAARGELDIIGRAEPITTVMEERGTDPVLKERLAFVQRVRDFASRALGLPDNGSFRRYARLDRLYAVWNVFAAPEFSVQSRQWCFPVAGCVNYKGYFHRAAAQEAAVALRRQGYDVYVAGVPAYSTLGWFDDPVLSTYIHYPKTRLAGLIFHELAHQRVYLPGDTTFNESFAVAVEQEGVGRWLARYGTMEECRQYRERQRHKRALQDLVLRYRDRLSAIYARALSPGERRVLKRQTMDRLRTEFLKLQTSWDGQPGDGRWADGPLNNARLAAVTLYTQDVDEFHGLLVRLGGNLKVFYSAVAKLAKLPLAQRRAQLAELASGASRETDMTGCQPATREKLAIRRAGGLLRSHN